MQSARKASESDHLSSSAVSATSAVSTLPPFWPTGDRRLSMSTPVTPLTQRPAWQVLAAHYHQIKDVQLRALFAEDPQRGERLAIEAAGLYLDYSKNRVTDETIRLLVRLAEDTGLRERIEAMF